MSESRAQGIGGASGETTTGGKSGGKCPICGKPADAAARPFCSKRCADVDLARWMNGVYVVPAGGDWDEEDGAPSDGGAERG